MRQGGCLLVDVLSVKLHPKAVLQQMAPPNCDVLCTHPMFGPESGRGSWSELPFVFEKVTDTNCERTERFLSVFETEGCTMVEMDAKKHDENAANSQFATHLVGRLLEQLKLSATPIDTVSAVSCSHAHWSNSSEALGPPSLPHSLTRLLVGRGRC